ncbi:hypothetical protein DXG01_015957, partial [Tephrocybe rancida]
MIEQVAEFQQTCFDIRAFLDFATIYTPHLAMSDEALRTIPVQHDLIGAVTESALLVQQLLKMRIPVWHLRPSYQLPKDINILSVELPTPLGQYMEFGTFNGKTETVLASGGPGTKRQMSMQHIGCVYLDLFIPRSELAIIEDEEERGGVIGNIDVALETQMRAIQGSEMVSKEMDQSKTDNTNVADSQSSQQSRPSTIVTPTARPLMLEAKGPAVQQHLPSCPLAVEAQAPAIQQYSLTPATPDTVPGHGRSRQGALLSRLVRGSGGRGLAPGPARAGQLQTSWNKFEEGTWFAMPSSNPTWSSALYAVGQSVANTTSPGHLGYAYPDPCLIAMSDAHRHIYFMMWLSRCQYVLWKELESHFRAEVRPRAQAWRDFLGSHLTVNETRTTKAACCQVEVAEWFSSKGIELCGMPTYVSWNGQSISMNELDHAIAMQVLWELYENNFHAKVLAVDCKVMVHEWAEPMKGFARDDLIQKVFFDSRTGEPGKGYLVDGILTEDMGLVAQDWRTWQQFVKNLHAIMKMWPSEKIQLPDFHEATQEAMFMWQEQR